MSTNTVTAQTPNFGKFQCKAKQSEAKANLKLIQVGEESYRAEHDTYVIAAAAELNIISVVIKGKSRYTYSVAAGSPDATVAIIASANGASEMPNDLWRLDLTTTSAAVTNVTDACDGF